MKNYTEGELRSCVDAGILTEQQFTEVQTHVHGADIAKEGQDSERFRLISGFNDIFVVVACALVLAAFGSLFGHLTGLSPSIGVAGGAWVLAEYFVRRRQMALPAVALALVFGGANLFFFVQSIGFGGYRLSLVCLVAAALQMLFWWRFRVPIAIAVVAGYCVLAIQILIAAQFNLTGQPGPEAQLEMGGPLSGALITIPLVQLVSGFAVFAFAMWWDMRDPQRQSYRADVAFWLHILAAPLIVSGAFSFVTLYGDNTVGLGHAVAVTLIYTLLAVVSLWVDRRALMLAALSVLVYTYSKVLAEYGIVSLNFAITGLVVGIGLLMLSVYWSNCRIAALKIIPVRLQKMLPDTVISN